MVCLVFMWVSVWSLNWTKTILEPTQTPVFLFDSNKTIAIPGFRGNSVPGLLPSWMFTSGLMPPLGAGVL